MNGKVPVLVGDPVFNTGVVGNALYPIYGANWRLTYLFTEGDIPAGRVPTPPNPVLG